MPESTRVRRKLTAIADRSERRTLYDVLQVAPEADQAVLRAAYYALARRKHPDLNNDTSATQRMSELNEAYELLNNPHRRAIYDLGLKKRPLELRPRSVRERVQRSTACCRCQAKLDAHASYCGRCRWLICDECHGCGCENPDWKPQRQVRVPALESIVSRLRSALLRRDPAAE
jgi:DnaJ-domain-containing protein 1